MPPAYRERPAGAQENRGVADADRTGRAEPVSLLGRRSRMARPAVPGIRGRGLWQGGAADLAGRSLRSFGMSGHLLRLA